MTPSGILEIDEYCTGVMAGDIPACHWVRKAVERFVSDLERDDFPYYFEPKAALHFIDFCENELVQFEGLFAGKPLKLEPWQKFVFGNIFGWLKKERMQGNPVRRFREAIIEIPKKQGKSILAAAIALYLIWYDGVSGAQVYGLAKNRSHAEKLSYRSARSMVKRNAALLKQFRINESAANIGIYNDEIDAFFSPLTSKPESTDGLNVHGAINDETKDWDDFEIYNVIKDGTISMYNSLILNITTAGFDQNSLGYERREYLTKILDGIYSDESTFGIIYTIDKGDEENWDKPEVWKKAMPNFGVSVSEESFIAKMPSCRNSPSQKNSFLVKHLNVWLSSQEGFIVSEKWDKCGKSKIQAPFLDLDKTMDPFKGRRAWGGLDMGSVDDFAAFVVVVENDENLDVVPFFWIPSETVQERKNKELVQGFIDLGYVKTTPGDTTDADYVESDIKTICSYLDVQEIAYDRFKLDMMVQHFLSDGLEMTPYGQGYVSMSPAIDELEKRVLQGKLNHYGNPVLRWMNSNVVITKDPSGNRKFDKGKAQDKIDGMVALAMALARSIVRGEQYQEVEEVRGFSIGW